MFKVSGPVSVYALRYNDKNIILFGDWHESTKQLCKPCKTDCVSVTNFFDKLKPHSDLFIESYYNSSIDFYAYNQDVISNVNLKNFDKMHSHNRQIHNNIRAHFSDIRSEKNLAIFYNTLSYYILKLNKGYKHEQIQNLNMLSYMTWCDSNTKFKKCIDVMLFSDDYIKDMSFVIPQEYNHYFTDKTQLKTLKGKKVTRLRKEFSEIPETYQKLIVQFHNDIIPKLLKKTKQFDKVMLKSTKGIHLLSNTDANVIILTLMSFLSYIKDVYTITRMLRYINRTNTIVSYDGASHSQTYAYFFKKYMNCITVHKEDPIHSPLSIGIPMKLGKFRCVSLPKHLIDEVIDISAK
jgi:hypothetical protein